MDIRSAQDFQKGHILGAVNLPNFAEENALEVIKLDRARPVIVVCAQGHQSPSVAIRLKAQEFLNVSVLQGGMNAWQGSGLPVVKN
ncbi:Thiosulfate sulfurtransferase GlpE [compost metagenome]